jgi:2-amino-4-hydroxy-6-hydroxymethyldihydropteridine diphosphokinase
MTGIYLSLGTNLGDREQNLFRACELLTHKSIIIKKASSIYQTAAWGKTDQPDFYNQVIEVDTDLNPYFLLKKLNRIESEMGRVRIEKWGERLIDIDILYYNEEIISDKYLHIPHPEIQNRKFILEPLVEIASAAVHPVSSKSQSELYQLLDDNLSVIKL